MNKQLFANPNRCTGCNRCLYACSAVKEGEFAPSLARLHISHFALRGYSVPGICFQCVQADCLDACPNGAIHRDAAGVVQVEAELCSGCGACARACAYGMIEVSFRRIACKCDTCGGDPACVKECASGALLYEAPNGDLVRLKAAQMKSRIKVGTPGEKRRRLAVRLMKSARD